MKSLITMAIAAVTAIATPALAENTFTGPRVEARLGFDNAKLNAASATANGLAFGGGVGYDIALTPKVRLGVQAAVDSATTDHKFSGLLTVDAKRDIEAGARLGYVVSPSTLVYASAAYTNARTGVALDTKTGKVSLGSTNAEGYRLGGGVEVALTKHVYTGFEATYSDYGSGVTRNQLIAKAGFRF